MNWFKPTSISQKFTFSLMVIILMIMLTLSAALVVYNFKAGEKTLNQTFDNILSKTGISLPSALWKFNHDHVADYVDSVFINQDLVYTCIKSDGEVVTEKFHPKFQPEDLPRFREDSKFIFKEQPIFYQENRVGHVVMVLSKERIRRQMMKQSLIIISLAFINIVAIFVTTFYLSKKHIFIPLKEFERSVNQISRGNLDARIRIDTLDEIGTVAKAFDQMAENLQATMASRDELEQEIAVRKAAEEHSTVLAGILEQSMNEIYVFDAVDLKFVMVNEGAKKNIGYAMAELERMTPLDIQSEYDRTSYAELIEPLLSGEKTALHFNTVHRRKDHSTYPVEVYLQLMRFDSVSVFAAVILDITERLASNEKLLASVKEKEVLLREIHHRVKNNMQIIQSLLNLQMGKFDNPDLVRVFQDSNNRIKSMALIHETLYLSDDLANLDIRVYVGQITSYLSKIYIDPNRPVHIDLDIDEICLDLDKSIACGLIINELVTNALKYAFSDIEKREIHIRFKQETSNRIFLAVSDTGTGLSESIDPDHIETLGLKIVQMLAQDQLDGNLSIVQGERLSFCIDFPLRDEEEPI
ncbi:MAG: PAS domain S-box protein [Desulfobacterales bacterium]|nr:PAS domain S-box protein [Desulfobacterales bacterium]